MSDSSSGSVPPLSIPQLSIPPQWVIEKKRDKEVLSEEEIRGFMAGYTDGSIPDYQMAALAMAIYLNGMTFEETAFLTDAMMRSGELLDTSSLTRPKADKHSTGGIGDKVSLVLGPIAAACGLDVPMISGRGLGITGGTLDKFEAIPGYRTDLSEAEMIKVIQACGCSIVGQTRSLAPADKKLYGLRDVTATVPSIPLITASIMCKKLAEGIDSLVLDVKWGRGAFMKELDQARDLASNMVQVGRSMDKKVSAVITRMDQPLGRSAGNAVEVQESIDCLKGNGPEDLMEVTLALTAEMLVLSEVADSPEAALAQCQAAIDSGAALEKFRHMVELHGGNPAVIDDPTVMTAAQSIEPFAAPNAGYVTDVNAEAIGRGVLVLGAGRTRAEDGVDHAVGVSQLVKAGEFVEAGQPLCLVHANPASQLEEAHDWFGKAFSLSDEAPESNASLSLITETLR